MTSLPFPSSEPRSAHAHAHTRTAAGRQQAGGLCRTGTVTARVAGRRARPGRLRRDTAALLYWSLPDLNWAGFYLVEPRTGDLLLGPFQGKPGCVRIPIGKGVCGTAAGRRETVIVADVHAFEGHIACDSASNSEAVVPILDGERLIGVLDSTARSRRASTRTMRGTRGAGAGVRCRDSRADVTHLFAHDRVTGRAITRGSRPGRRKYVHVGSVLGVLLARPVRKPGLPPAPLAPLRWRQHYAHQPRTDEPAPGETLLRS